MCNVINVILFELAGTTVDSLPHSSTISQCVSVITQVSEVMYTNENLTLSCDSTAVDGTHINGHIISVNSTGKVPNATICCWTQEDIEEEGEDGKICILHAGVYWLF